MKEQMHLAAQYLAAAGISFLDKKEDDSHTNLGFYDKKGCLETHYLSENKDQLLLDYNSFSLEWISKSGSITFSLNGATHAKILVWLKETSMTFLNKPYVYQFHYELPYEITDDYTFKLTDAKELAYLMHLRTLAQKSLKKITKENNLEATVRVWPHHFDTGIYTAVPNSNITIGLGLAIPDTVCDMHYFYNSGYDENGQINPSKFKALTKGYWSLQDFLGGVLPAKKVKKNEAVTFFNEAIKSYTAFK
ncbi:hypothetical protein KO500_12500 [Cellulophaga baltica]|uniref:hypothetical protein n=1 Tax=Cellulophaga TaxID=104264 RepID=UPI001C068E1B|nr:MULTISPECIES: hypothetical protein [Cellulophaga]MBU2997260.1 hypothetical protein [Cellulophaga baltica]MDO6768658.1 hypothetical protein [Cellulophaga sp. 1_MG-2023]